MLLKLPVFIVDKRAGSGFVTAMSCFYGIRNTITPVDSNRGSALICIGALRDSMLPEPSPVSISRLRRALWMAARAMSGVLLSCDR